MTRQRRRHLPRLFLGLLLYGLLMPAMAEPLLKPFKASFSVSRGVIPLGNLKLEFNLDKTGTYTYRAHTRPGFLTDWFSGEEILEESTGRLLPWGVVSETYRYTETANPTDNVEIHLNWSEMKAYTTSEGVTWAQEIEPETQDRLSQQLMARLQLAQGREALSYRVADGGKLKHYRFKVVGEEPVKTPYGRYRCLKVERRKESRPADYAIWFARKLDYLPIRIERWKGGNRYQMELEELEGL